MKITNVGKKSAVNIPSSVSIIMLCAAICLMSAAAAEAIALDQGERVTVGLVTPVENNTGHRVWGSKYYPGDVLPIKMEEYVIRRLRTMPRSTVASLPGFNPNYWSMNGSSPNDLIMQIGLEYMHYRKSDLVGSQVRGFVDLRLSVFDPDYRLVYDTVIKESGSRYYPLYSTATEGDYEYWDEFEKGPIWPVIRSALDEAINDTIAGYNGYRIVGRIVARAERVDGSLTVPRSKQDKIFHITLGREDSVRVGDLLAVTRASSVRTIAPETPEIHFPQVVARVRVIFLKGRDGVVEIVKESSDAPIQLGDALSAPLYGRRTGSATF